MNYLNADDRERKPLPDVEASYRRTISIHCPNCTEAVMAQRVDLCVIRDRASAARMRASEPAIAILSEVSKLATFAVFADMPLEKLWRLKIALQSALNSAWILDLAMRDCERD